MQQRLEGIKKFLKENSHYNKELQIRFALGSIGTNENTFNKLIALLYDTANTQSQPKMDLLAIFFKDIYKNKDDINSFDSFVKYINNGKFNQKTPYESLYKGLKSQKGWGEKTSALFVKNIYNYHYNFQQDKERKELKIWSDVPKLNENDKLYLPVDSVIKVIFNALSPKMNRNNKFKDWTFNNINKTFQGFSNKDVILFDDLWFWGFITQRVENKYRKLEWNDDKYWMIKESCKDEHIIQTIKDKAEIFLKLIKGKHE